MGTVKIIAFLCLAIFLILYGLAAVTNFRMEAMATVTGLAALVAGILFGILAVRG